MIYDEVTNFKDVSSYPFEKRKNTLSANLNTGYSSKPGMYKDALVSKIFLNLNKVCYDKQWYSDILFWRDDEYCEQDDEDKDDASKYKYNKI